MSLAMHSEGMGIPLPRGYSKAELETMDEEQLADVLNGMSKEERAEAERLLGLDEPLFTEEEKKHLSSAPAPAAKTEDVWAGIEDQLEKDGLEE